MPLIQANEDAIKDLKSKTEIFISPNINDISQSIDFILNQHVTATAPSNIQVPSMNSQNLALVDSLEERIEELETQQQSLGHLDSQHGQFTSGWNQQRSENIDFKGIIYIKFYFEDPDYVEKCMRANMNHPLHGLFADILFFRKFFVNKSYIECNEIFN